LVCIVEAEVKIVELVISLEELQAHKDFSVSFFPTICLHWFVKTTDERLAMKFAPVLCPNITSGASSMASVRWQHLLAITLFLWSSLHHHRAHVVLGSLRKSKKGLYGWLAISS
jgi:hypothetical protein